MTSIFTQQLLVLHYLFPLSWHKIQRLIAIIGDLDELTNCSASELANYLSIKEDKALYLQTNYKKLRNTSMTTYYNQLDIHPIPYLFQESFVPKG